MAHEKKGIQETTRDKYKTIARAKAMRHDELEDHVTAHMLNCDDEDCDICDLGQSGSMIDDDDEGEGKEYDIGSRSSKGREGAGDIDSAGEEAEKDTKSDKHNLMKHGEHLKHSAKHPGFRAVAKKIAGSQHVSQEAANRILAFRSRHASASAKKENPRLKRV